MQGAKSVGENLHAMDIVLDGDQGSLRGRHHGMLGPVWVGSASEEKWRLRGYFSVYSSSYTLMRFTQVTKILAMARK